MKFSSGKEELTDLLRYYNQSSNKGHNLFSAIVGLQLQSKFLYHDYMLNNHRHLKNKAPKIIVVNAFNSYVVM